MSLGHALAEHVRLAGAKYPRFHLHRELTLMLIRIATKPKIVTSPKTHADNILAFRRAYAHDPDAVLGCLTFLRGTIKKWQSYPAGFVRLYLRQHALYWKAEWNGQPVPLSGMEDKELADYLTPLAGFTITVDNVKKARPITADDVKKARQKIAKEDKTYGRYERPDAQQYMRDGLTPELKRRLQRMTKGRKKTVRVGE